MKATVLGAAGGIGQPLSLLLKQNTDLTSLSLYDIAPTVGIAADLSHIPTPATVTGYSAGEEGLQQALTGADVVVIPAGIPRKPGMTRDDLFRINAGIVRDLAVACVKYAPSACICVISNPVNSTAAIVSEVFKAAGVYNPKKIFGVTTLDIIRASTFVGQVTKSNPSSIVVPVVGGHSGTTIVPLFSKVKEASKLTNEEISQLTNRVQFGGDEVVKAKDGAGSATLSMAVAGARFASSVVKGLKGEKVIESAYVALSSDAGGSAGVRKLVNGDYFAVQVELSKEGVGRIIEWGNVNEYEQGLINAAVTDVNAAVKKGVEFVANNPKL